MIDLHAHILPGLDDGPENIKESLKVVEALQKAGFTHIFATPHHRLHPWVRISPETVEQSVEALAAASVNMNPAPTLLPGMEYDLDGDLADRVRRRPGGGGHVLVDPGFFQLPINTYDILRPLAEEGLRVLIVHPERNARLLKKNADLDPLKMSGIEFLGNIGSLGGMYGRAIRKGALGFLDAGKYWALATDIHSPEQARFMDRGLEVLEKKAGVAAMRVLLFDNPMKIVREMEKKDLTV